MKIGNLEKLLRENSYPGRGILIGRSEDNRNVVAAYFIMGRSENSRNRIFEKTDDGIKTKAFDPAKLTDPSLVIYRPVRINQGRTIITNGDQTDTVYDFLQKDQGFITALRTREFEPDSPNYTPRISGLIEADGSYTISILKSSDGNPECCVRNFFEFEKPIAGCGHFISTYKSDGEPLPSFEGEPILVEIKTSDSLDVFANTIWNALNDENKISLYTFEKNISTGAVKDIIFNKNN